MPIAATFEIEYLQYLDADGKLVRDDLPAFARDVKQLVELYKLMLFVRVFDSKAIALQRTGKLGTYASCLGHEAAHVAIGSAMQEDDVFAPMYREYGAQFCRGVKPREVLLYWGGDERGNDFSGPAHDFAWCVPIATQCLHAAGSALAFKIRKEPRVAVTVVGDGGSSKADFYGAINVDRRDARCRWSPSSSTTSGRSRCRARRRPARRRWRRKASPPASNACRSTATISSRCAPRWITRSSARATVMAAW